jgi:hypothetical protein
MNFEPKDAKIAKLRALESDLCSRCFLVLNTSERESDMLASIERQSVGYLSGHVT